MKNLLVILAIVFCYPSLSNAQDWMTSLPIAKKLALAQDKLLFMMWEESALYQGPVSLENEYGILLVEDDFLNNQRINEAIWEHFVPVIVNESEYEALYKSIEDNRTPSYLTAFGDDSMKIMDPNGNIIGTSSTYTNFLNLSKFLKKYAYKTVFVNEELTSYNREKDFYSALYLANRYVDFAVYVNRDVRNEILDLATIYFNEADELLKKQNKTVQLKLQQRMELYRLIPFLVQKKPKKVLRALKKFDENGLLENKDLVAYSYYTAYLLLEDWERVEEWKNKLSLVNLRKAQLINNI